MRPLLLSIAVLLALPPNASAAEAVVVKSADLGPYAAAVAGFSAEFKGRVSEYSLENDAEGAEKLLAKVKQARPAVVLAIGPLAANSAKRALGEIPVVFVMVPNHEKYGLEGGMVTGIALSRPIKSQLETLKALAPATRRVGVVYNPKYSKSVVESGVGAARGIGLELVSARVDSPEEVLTSLQALSGKVDALWMIADRSVATDKGVQAIVDFSLRNKVPLFALSESQVRDGALVSLSPNFTNIGQQAGRLANRIVLEKLPAGSLPVAVPEGLDLAINLSTAKRIGVECNLALEIFKYAAKAGYPIRVFE
ncbi:MAG TPA: ABC transporter substrate-binding protein [Myxococcales bacterium]|nr:ABC transporter substrate-binding protein [Myxococcales bacterium]